MILTGRQVGAEEALRIGLADEVVPHEELHDRAFALAAELARGPLLVQGYAKAAIDGGLSTSLAEGLLLERERFADAFGTEDGRIGVRELPRAGRRQGHLHRPLSRNSNRSGITTARSRFKFALSARTGAPSLADAASQPRRHRSQPLRSDLVGGPASGRPVRRSGPGDAAELDRASSARHGGARTRAVRP